MLLQALASQAGIAIENTIPQKDINALFEGFVNASVAAIEQRDPTTSGHSFRVSDLCVGLAESVSLSNLTRLRNSRFTETEVRELRYAALLHDFGKVGVRKSVLVKEKKLIAGSLENIQYRILLAKERLKTQSLSKQIAMFRTGGLNESRFAELDRKLAVDTDLHDEFYRTIVEANETSMLEEDNREMLDRINAYRMESQDADLSIITPE